MSEPAPVAPEEIARAAELARKHFGHASLRPGQGEVLARALRGESVLAVLPTGGGKSLLYQLPALVSPGVTLVVSPLIALMKDQLDGLDAPKRAASVAVTSELAPHEHRAALEAIAAGAKRLVYAAPERLRQTPFLEALKRGGVRRLVVDEAHCVSLWGHDFRPDYLALAEARRLLGNPPVLAATATAPPHVREEILARLGPATVVASPVFRPNLRFEAIVARDADEKLAHLLHLVREETGSVLVYASSRAKCETIAAALRAEGIAADHYHAGADDRPARQEAFMSGEVRVLVATVAFGMGVDKPDVRLLVHVDPSGSMEAYVQEAGRAGRDGLPARCVLLAATSDASALSTRARSDLPSKELLENVRLLAGSAARPDGYALVPADELARLDPEPGKPRLALSLLAASGFAEILGDVPRAFLVDGPGPLAAFARREADPFDVAAALGVEPQRVLGELLDRAARGEVRFGARAPDVLLRMRDSGASAEGALERYTEVAVARGRKVLDYAKGRACRHAQVARHFGDRWERLRCDACDVCLRVSHELPASARPDDDAAALKILEGAADFRGIGLTNLVLMLRGDAGAAPWTDRSSARGALAGRSEGRIKALVRDLLASGHLVKESLEHGGEALRISEQGLAAVRAGNVTVAASRLSPTPPAPAAEPGVPGPVASAPAKPRRAKAEEAPLSPADEKLFEALRAWRAELARAASVPAYVVAPDKTLRAVAEARPATPEALLAVPGIGPAKLATFGEDILRIVREHAPS